MNLEMLCDCDCESNIQKEDVVSSMCNGQGTLKCGICECFDGYFGNHCECSDTTGGIIDHTLSCRAVNATVDCSGRGTCFCGVCECDKRQNPNEVYFSFTLSLSIFRVGETVCFNTFGNINFFLKKIISNVHLLDINLLTLKIM